jgi:hypothetical protein
MPLSPIGSRENAMSRAWITQIEALFKRVRWMVQPVLPLVMLEEVYLEEAGRHGGVVEPGEDTDGPVEAADGLGPRGTADLHPLSGLMQELVDGAGVDFFEFVGDRIGHGVCISEPDKGQGSV